MRAGTAYARIADDQLLDPIRTYTRVSRLRRRPLHPYGGEDGLREGWGRGRNFLNLSSARSALSRGAFTAAAALARHKSAIIAAFMLHEIAMSRLARSLHTFANRPVCQHLSIDYVACSDARTLRVRPLICEEFPESLTLPELAGQPEPYRY